MRASRPEWAIWAQVRPEAPRPKESVHPYACEAVLGPGGPKQSGARKRTPERAWVIWRRYAHFHPSVRTIWPRFRSRRPNGQSVTGNLAQVRVRDDPGAIPRAQARTDIPARLRPCNLNEHSDTCSMLERAQSGACAGARPSGQSGAAQRARLPEQASWARFRSSNSGADLRIRAGTICARFAICCKYTGVRIWSEPERARPDSQSERESVLFGGAQRARVISAVPSASASGIAISAGLAI